ncbi:MAG: tRNA (adenosine(37)-N6)-dimethylallyltransferase MiaA [Armatimonadetes bacterium]|nr:tRNA (adenosine(37)-N6)-dimethylallyltransferase MiaA [Armatimonadota bacterium]
MSEPDARQRLLALLKTHALRVAAPGESFTLASGRQSHYFVNGKEVTLRADGLALVAELFLERLAGADVQAVGGMTLGADPIVGAMVAQSAGTAQPLLGFIVRKASKDHGLGDRIAGPSLAGIGRVVMVEDTTTTGGSTLDAIAALREAHPDITVDRVLSIVDREEGAGDNFAAAGYRRCGLMRPRVLGLLGPTAVGKTAVAVELCERLPGEVISADSRQIYRGLTIGSSAPTAAELARAAHHLVGFVDPRETYSVARFRDDAEKLIGESAGRGRTPVLTAGTGMYLKALLSGWTLTGVPPDAALRRRLEAEGAAELHRRLAAVDPAAAERIAETDLKRLVRALEVFEASGRTLTEHLREPAREAAYDVRLYGLRRPREELYARIDQRVEAMLAAGWPDEVRGLLDAGLTGDEPAMEGLGYRRLAAVVRGETALAEAVPLIQQDTRRFAKRQMTWFRAFADVRWVDLAAAADPIAVAEAILSDWQRADPP